jgi:hypothetical protein
VTVLTVTGRLTNEPARRDVRHGVVDESRLAVDDPPCLWISLGCWGQPACHCGHRNGEAAATWLRRAEPLTFRDRRASGGEAAS